MPILTNGFSPNLKTMSDDELSQYRVRIAQRRRNESLSDAGMPAGRAVDFANEFERIRAEAARRPTMSMNDDNGGRRG